MSRGLSSAPALPSPGGGDFGDDMVRSLGGYPQKMESEMYVCVTPTYGEAADMTMEQLTSSSIGFYNAAPNKLKAKCG